MKPLLDVEQMAIILCVKAKTLYQWAELGQIPCLKMNGALRFDLNDVERWMQGCKRGYNFRSQNRCQ